MQLVLLRLPARRYPSVRTGMTEIDAVNGDYLTMKGAKGKFFTLGISALDCTGCGSCAQVCPARKKALEIVPAEDDVVSAAQKKYDYLFSEVTEKEVPFKEDTVKGSQFKQPLLSSPALVLAAASLHTPS